jgi:hypothetical protein
MCVHTSHQPYGIHLLCCAHGNECVRTHDVIRNTFITIAQDVSFHVGWKQLHTLPLTTLNFFRRQVDIMFTKDGIHTLVDIIITNPMHVDLLPQSCTTQRFVASDGAQAKKINYCD